MTLQSTKKPLDGGWGWAVVVASFLALFLAYGSPQSVGVLYPEWLSTYQEGKGMTAWVGSLVSGIGLIASPICSACVVNFGARPVTIFSGVMVSGGLMLSAFAPNVQFLIFSYGVVVGLGCGLVYAATMTITCQYFDKRRGLALGIVSTGTSFGGFVYATGQNELIKLFGLDGCLLIIGSLALNIIACGGPMRPLHVPAYYLKQKAAALEKAEGQLLEKVVTSDPDSVKPPPPAESDKKTAEDPLITKEMPAETPLAFERSFSICAILVEVIKTKQKSYLTYLRSTADLFQDRVFGALCVSIFLYSLGAFPPLCLHRRRVGTGAARHPHHQELRGAAGHLRSYRLHVGELVHHAVRHHQGGGYREAHGGPRHPHVLWRFRDHAGTSSCRLVLRLDAVL